MLKCLRSLYGKQCVPIGAVCSGSTLFASILSLSLIKGNYLQQTTTADGRHFQMHFFYGALSVKLGLLFKRILHGPHPQ